MSTLATNKLGTLSGKADMSLPTTRPASTKSAFLDSAGNLTFEDSNVKCEFIVVAGTAKVVKILVDVYTQNMDNVRTAILTGTGSTDQAWGATLGTWNLPSAIKSNYFKDGNVRWWDFYGNGSAHGTSGNFQNAQFYTNILDSSQSVILGDQSRTQNIGYSYWKVESNTTSSKGGSGATAYWYNDNSGSNSGNQGFGTGWNQNDSSNIGVAPWFYQFRLLPWMNGYWKLSGRFTAHGSSSSYGPQKAWGYTQAQMQYTVKKPASGNYGDRAYMGAYPAGFSVTSSSNNNSNKTYGFTNMTLTATIKPTDVVVA